MKNSKKEFEVRQNLGGKKLILTSGDLAFQSSGAVMAQYGETVVLAAVVFSPLREKLGYFDHPPSYTAFLFREITGWEPPDEVINKLTLGLLLAAFVASVAANGYDFIKKKKGKRQPSKQSSA